MPVNKQLYKSIVPINNDATRTYSRERIERINADKLYVTIGGKKVLKSSLNLNKGTLKEIPSDYVEKANKKDAVLEKIGWQDKAGKPAILQGLAKTVGASAAMATGAAYSTPVVGTLGGLARNIVAGGVGAEGFAMLDGRPATPTELAVGTIMETGMPMAMKGASKLYGKMFNNKTTTPIVENVVQEATPIVKKESIYQHSVPFKIEQPNTNTLQLKSTMMGSPLEKQLSKDGMLSINSLQAHLNNPSTSIADRTMIRKVLDERFAGQSKINYNDLRKAVSDEMVPLEKNFDSNHSNYGLKNIGYQTSNTKPNINLDDEIRGYTEMANNPAYDEVTRTGYRLHIDELKKIKENPKENTSIVYSNKEKFGRGSTDHFENEGTLGHSRILVSNEEPDVMHILEQQSDYYQKHDMKYNLENMTRNVNRLNELLKNKITLLEHMKATNTDLQGNPITPIDIKNMEMVIKSQTEANKLNNGNLANYTQKELLGKTHQDRLLQENVAYAAQNGQTMMRYPTPETAAKIQGYTPTMESNKLYNLPDGTKGYYKHMINNNVYFTKEGAEFGELVKFDKNVFETSNNNLYSSEHQTILKKYADNPKMIKKILGQDTRTVTDSKGNSWYEFDIPEAFRKGKAEIKALSTIGAIATGYKEIVDKNKNK